MKGYAGAVRRLKQQARDYAQQGTERGSALAFGCVLLINEMRRRRGMKPRGTRRPFLKH